MVSSIIRNFIAKRMFQQKGAIANNKSVEFSANALEQRLKNLGVDPNTIKSEGELNQILSFVKQAEDQAFNQKFGNALSGNKFQKKAEVVDLKNKKLDTEKPILGGTQETDEQMIQRFKKQNEDSINRLKNKKKPEDMAGGGVAGLLGERTGYEGGLRADAPNPRILELMLNEKMSYEDALKEFEMREKQRPYIEERMGTGPGPILEAASGGIARTPFKMGKRAFLKAMGAGVAGIAGLKTGLFGLGKKAAVKTAAPIVADATTVPPHFFKLVAKIKALGDNVTSKSATKDREIVKQYKDFEMTEDISTGEIQIFKRSQSDEAIDRFGGENATEEVFMRYKPGKGQIDETTKGKTPLDEYEENTSYISNNRENTGNILDDVDGVPDDILKEVEAGSGNVPESFYTGPNAIKKADGGRIGYAVGKKVIGKGIMAGINKLFGKGTMTTADKIKIPQKTLDRNMFKKFETNNPKLSEVDQDLLIRGKELDLDPEIMKTTYKSFIDDKGGIGSLKEFHADFVKQTGKNIPIDNLRQAWRLKRTYPFNTPVVDKTGNYIGGEATQKMYPESKKFLVEESAESFMKPKVKKTTEREFIDVPPMPKGFKLSREKLEKNYPELDEDMIDQIMELDKEMQGTVLTMLKNRRQNPDAYDKLLETKGDTLEFQGEFDKVTRRKNNATGGLAAMLGE